MEKPTYEVLEKKVKFMQNELENMNFQLEQVEKQLRRRQRMDSLGTLAQGVAHDFNNILSGIMAYLNILSLTSDNFTPSQKTYIQNIIDAVRRGAATIGQFQKLSASTMSEKADIDLYRVAREVFSLLEETTDKMIEKKLRLQKDQCFVHADINEIHQVLMNLGTNAVHAIEKKGVTRGDYICLSVETVDAKDIFNEVMPGLPPEFYRIRFEDTGCGIDDHIVEKIFDPLFTTKDDEGQKGQGLGLAMVWDIIVKRHGGKIQVTSSPGKGTLFDLILPKAAGKKEETDDTPDFFGGTETILVVDDDPAVSESIRTALEDFGYNLILAMDGEEGLNLFKEKHGEIDAVLLDIIMPKMSGKEVLREMLKIDPDVKVIISSGQLEAQQSDQILESAKNYLHKPFEIDTLEVTLRQVIDM